MPIRKSKKGSKKKTPPTSPPPPPQEELPQVWLPVTEELNAQEIRSFEEGEGGGERDEQLASLWVEDNPEGGWNESEELDYGQIAASLGLPTTSNGEELSIPQIPVHNRPPLVGGEREEGTRLGGGEGTRLGGGEREGATRLGGREREEGPRPVLVGGERDETRLGGGGEREGEQGGMRPPLGGPGIRQPGGGMRPPALHDCESVDGLLRDEMEETIQPLEETPTRSRLPSSPGSGLQSETHSLFNYAQSSVYAVYELGILHDISNDWTNTDTTSNDPNNLLKLIEHAQRRGLIPWSSQSNSDRILVLSKYGIKVTDTKRQRVYIRHTLHTIMSVVHYLDTKGQSLLAVKIQKQESQEEEEASAGSFNLYVYQCQSENQATDICIMLGQVFDAILNKMKLEDNLGVLR